MRPYNHTITDKRRVRTQESVGIVGVAGVVLRYCDVLGLAGCAACHADGDYEQRIPKRDVEVLDVVFYFLHTQKISGNLNNVGLPLMRTNTCIIFYLCKLFFISSPNCVIFNVGIIIASIPDNAVSEVMYALT